MSADDRRSVDLPPLVCPNCCEDLYVRPPRSYAELEGIRDHAGAHHEVRSVANRWARRAHRTEWAMLVTLGVAGAALMIWQFAGLNQIGW